MLKCLVTATALVIAGGVASAEPVAPAINAASTNVAPRIVLVSGGCGFAFHRTPYGDCVPNRGPGPVIGRLPPPCPPGYYRDPDPARRLCYPYR